MTLKLNIFAGYASQIYVTLVGIITLPFYIKYMGAEAYGLVGFFAMLQACFSLLDMGLTPTISRETARLRAGSYSSFEFSQLFRALSMLFWCVAIVGGGVLYLGAPQIAEHWLNLAQLSTSEVSFALQIMAVSIALRWLAGLYRGVVTGSECLVWLSGFNSVIATFRFLIIFPVLWTYGATPSVFFTYQLLVAFVEFLCLWYKAKILRPQISTLEKSALVWSIAPVRSVLTFSLSIALTSGIWLLVTQTDKLIMSKLLSLEEYGYFTLAVLVASGISLLSAPISGAIMPRMATLEAEGKREELVKVYRQATQFTTVIVGSIGIMFVAFAKPILFVWTGDEKIVAIAAPVLQLYSAGYAVLAIAAFPFYLQYALGQLKLHMISSALFVSVLLPVLWLATEKFGMIGAGYAWLFVNVLYFIVLTGIVHKTYVPGLHVGWLLNDILKILVLPVAASFALMWIFVLSDRFVILVELVIFGSVLFFLAILFTEQFKKWLLKI